MVFFLVAAVLTLIVAAVLVRPLLRPLSPPPAAARYNMAVYRDQLEELRRDAERGAITPQDAAAAQSEIERRLLSAAREVSPDAAPRRAPAALALALVAALFLGGGAIYLALGRPMAPDQPLALRVAQARAQAQTQGSGEQAEMGQMVDLLARKLAADPNHPDGWALLARSELHLGRTQAALDAYARAVSLSPKDDPALDGEYAEARVIAGDGQVDPAAAALFRKRLAAEPKDPQARYYLALAKAEGGDTAGALSDWRALEASSPPDAPWLPTLRQRIAQASGQPAPPPAAGAASGPTADQVAAASQMGEQDRAKMVQGMVDRLAARLKTQPNDVEGWRRLARAYQVLGRTAEAEAAERQVLRLAPDDADARAALPGR